MPVFTTSAMETKVSVEPSKTVKQSSTTTKSASPKQHNSPEDTPSSTQEKLKEPCPPQDHDKQKQLPVVTETPSPSSLLSSDIIKTIWPCRKCLCRKGAFRGLADSCVDCKHSMDHHEISRSNPWNHQTDYLCERQELVTSTLEHARKCGVVVIRAPPMVGKSVLLMLLGHHIANHELDLEPVYVEWENREERKNLPYQEYLSQEAEYWQRKNTAIRPRNPDAQTMYLIDEAQNSYEEKSFWRTLKNRQNTRSANFFVLVCVYGAAGVSRKRDPNIESQAQRMHALQRIELRPSFDGNPCMLFQKDEVGFMVKKFAIQNKFLLQDGVVEYLYHTTGGHPGMLGMLILHLGMFFKRTGNPVSQTLSPKFLHEVLVQHEYSFIEWLCHHGRGVWSPECERYVENDCLAAPQYSHLTLLDVKKALREVAIQPDGLTRLHESFDAFAFCHKQGLLHTETPKLGRRGEVKFTFASPLHRRVAYRRLFPGREPDAVLRNLSLLQICTNAIARFSPGTLQSRRYSQSNSSWGIPEAAFQDELYSCLNLELHYLPILSEYSHTKDGRIDFYVSDRRWGIEVLQCGSEANIAEHTARFVTGGKYKMWDIMDDYIILNFCPRSALRDLCIEDERIRSHVFHVVIEPDELTAEIYTYDKQLHKSWSLSEGRRRINTEDFNGSVSEKGNHSMPLQDEIAQQEERVTRAEVEIMKLEMEKMRLQMEREKEMRLQMEREKEMRLQMKREIENLKLQMEREKRERRLQIEEEEDQEVITQKQKELGKRKR